MPLRTEEAYDFLIAHLARIPPTVGRHSLVATRYAHVYLPDLVMGFWQSRGPSIPFGDLTDEHFRPFYDAAWELARLGVIRPGRIAPKGQEMANDFGDLWSMTAFGFEWLPDASKRPYLDMSRLSEVFASFAGRFGPGFAQRAVEAVRTYRTGNYLSACAMVGAAAESILLAVAVAKKRRRGEDTQDVPERRRPFPPHHLRDRQYDAFGCTPIRVCLACSALLARRRVPRRSYNYLRS